MGTTMSTAYLHFDEIRLVIRVAERLPPEHDVWVNDRITQAALRQARPEVRSECGGLLVVL
jgi:hypothetical protein